MSKFIIVTDVREPVGVEQVVGRKVLVSVDHIIKVEALEPHIAEALNYKATITLVSSGQYSNHVCTKETYSEIIDLIYADVQDGPASIYW
jgi:hypothetical protein